VEIQRVQELLKTEKMKPHEIFDCLNTKRMRLIVWEIQKNLGVADEIGEDLGRLYEKNQIFILEEEN